MGIQPGLVGWLTDAICQRQPFLEPGGSPYCGSWTLVVDVQLGFQRRSRIKVHEVKLRYSGIDDGVPLPLDAEGAPL